MKAERVLFLNEKIQSSAETVGLGGQGRSEIRGAGGSLKGKVGDQVCELDIGEAAVTGDSQMPGLNGRGVYFSLTSSPVEGVGLMGSSAVLRGEPARSCRALLAKGGTLDFILSVIEDIGSDAEGSGCVSRRELGRHQGAHVLLMSRKLKSLAKWKGARSPSTFVPEHRGTVGLHLHTCQRVDLLVERG